MLNIQDAGLFMYSFLPILAFKVVCLFCIILNFYWYSYYVVIVKNCTLSRVIMSLNPALDTSSIWCGDNEFFSFCHLHSPHRRRTTAGNLSLKQSMQNQKRSNPARPQPNQCFSATREINFAKEPKQPKQTTTTIFIRDIWQSAGWKFPWGGMHQMTVKISRIALDWVHNYNW